MKKKKKVKIGERRIVKDKSRERERKKKDRRRERDRESACVCVRERSEKSPQRLNGLEVISAGDKTLFELLIRGMEGNEAFNFINRNGISCLLL